MDSTFIGMQMTLFSKNPFMGVCVDDCWFKQPNLARVRLIGLWGWVRLHTCFALRNQYTQVKPSITRHTLGEFS